jgi:hypothetical protein
MFALAVEVPFDGSDGLWEFFSDEYGCEAWPSGEVAIVDGFDPGRWDRASTGGVQVGDQVGLCRCMVGTVCMVLRMREGPRWLSSQVPSVLELVGGALSIDWFRGRDIL